MRKEELADSGAVLVILTDGKNILLVLDLEKPFPHYWKLPGGGVESGENAIQAAAREAWEETGIAIDPHELQWLRTQYLETHHKRTFIARISSERLASHAPRGNDGEMVGLFNVYQALDMVDLLEEHRVFLKRFLSKLRKS